MNEKMKAYILKNHDKYGICNEAGELLSESEMLGLLNILESHGENLDSFHDVAINGAINNLFCEIWGRWGDDSENYGILRDFNIFYTPEQFAEYVNGECRERWEDELDYNIKEYGDFATYFREYWDCEIVRTSDGYVRQLEY